MRYVSIFIAFLVVCGCENAQFGAREKGTLAGGALGAGLGAIIGNQVGSTGAGIAIGGAMGALGGGLIGNEVDRADQQVEGSNRRVASNAERIRKNQSLIDELKRRGADVRETDRGVVVNLPDVLFEFDKAALTYDAERVISQISEVLRDARTRRISVEGHTDSVGTISYNQRLSEDRAHSVAGELVRQGISRRRVSTRGFGESDPVASNRTASGRARNRRVEVVIEN